MLESLIILPPRKLLPPQILIYYCELINISTFLIVWHLSGSTLHGEKSGEEGVSLFFYFAVCLYSCSCVSRGKRGLLIYAFLVCGRTNEMWREYVDGQISRIYIYPCIHENFAASRRVQNWISSSFLSSILLDGVWRDKGISIRRLA